VDPAVSPQRILFGHADGEAGDAADCWRAAGFAPSASAVFSRGQLAVPGQQRRWRQGEDLSPAHAGYQLCQRGEPYPVGRLVPDPSGVPAQDGVLVPERQQFSVLVQIPAGEQDREAEHPANQQVDDRERHPVSQPSPPPGRRGKRRSATESSIRAAQLADLGAHVPYHA